jgi:hypothetical protein
LDGADGYVPHWVLNFRLSERFPAVAPWEWDTPRGRLWARRYLCYHAAERDARQLRGSLRTIIDAPAHGTWSDEDETPSLVPKHTIRVEFPETA